jgi:hypothetical protein
LSFYREHQHPEQKSSPLPLTLKSEFQNGSEHWELETLESSDRVWLNLQKDYIAIRDLFDVGAYIRLKLDFEKEDACFMK